MKRNNLQDYIELFEGVQLSVRIADARKEAGKHFADNGYIVTHCEPVPGSQNKYDLVCTHLKHGFKVAVMIGNKSVRKMRLRDLDGFKGDKLYILRGEARTEPVNIYGVNVIKVDLKGSL